MHSRLVYISEATVPLSGDELRDIAFKAAMNNSLLGIHGILIYSGGNFIQCLEGARGPVCGLYDTIKEDARHTKINRVVFQQNAKGLMFNDWNMALLNVNECSSFDRRALRTRIEALLDIGLKADCQRVCIEALKEFRKQLPAKKAA